ncbi:hypothetical protein BC832DRAFT_460385 [Gaertneriomyces semiglobifer]|nr:hypothetical protein BC832DRAFT_460385 [Gaertneriomyces semiglobifer]
MSTIAAIPFKLVRCGITPIMARSQNTFTSSVNTSKSTNPTNNINPPPAKSINVKSVTANNIKPPTAKSDKPTKSIPSLTMFMLHQKSKNLYKSVWRISRLLSEDERRFVREWCRRDFERYRGETDEEKIRFLVQMGRGQLRTLEMGLGMGGVDTTTTTTKRVKSGGVKGRSGSATESANASESQSATESETESGRKNGCETHHHDHHHHHHHHQ